MVADEGLQGQDSTLNSVGVKSASLVDKFGKIVKEQPNVGFLPVTGYGENLRAYSAPAIDAIENDKEMMDDGDEGSDSPVDMKIDLPAGGYF